MKAAPLTDEVMRIINGLHSEDSADLLSQPFNDYGNGQRLIALHGSNMRYCHPFAKWLVWTGSHWVIDQNDSARKLAQETSLEFARQAMERRNDAAAKFAGQSLNSHKITASLREAEPHLAVSVEDLDRNPDLLNVRNGTIHLPTAQIWPHRREDLLTKWIPRNYHPEVRCPVWRAFLAQVLPGLEDFTQKAIGYSTTGHTSEKAVFFCHGGGNNGKTTLLATLREVIGEDYAGLLQIDTLMARTVDNNSQSDLADLRGKRFVMTSETEEGQRLAEGRLKRITQGMGKIKAVRKYENPIEFTESHKLWLDCNHKPIVRGADQAIWNRLHLIPFGVTIPKDRIDRELPQKLLSESEGILAWAIAGAARWYREGLGKPECVEAAGDEWRSQMDQISRFIDECCVTGGDQFRAQASTLYQAYRKWADDQNEHAVTATAFGLRLTEQYGYEKQKTMHGAFYLGVGLRHDGFEEHDEL